MVRTQVSRGIFHMLITLLLRGLYILRCRLHYIFSPVQPNGFRVLCFSFCLLVHHFCFQCCWEVLGIYVWTRRNFIFWTEISDPQRWACLYAIVYAQICSRVSTQICKTVQSGCRVDWPECTDFHPQYLGLFNLTHRPEEQIRKQIYHPCPSLFGTSPPNRSRRLKARLLTAMRWSGLFAWDQSTMHMTQTTSGTFQNRFLANESGKLVAHFWCLRKPLQTFLFVKKTLHVRFPPAAKPSSLADIYVSAVSLLKLFPFISAKKFNIKLPFASPSLSPQCVCVCVCVCVCSGVL